MEVSQNGGTSNSSIFIIFSIKKPRSSRNVAAPPRRAALEDQGGQIEGAKSVDGHCDEESGSLWISYIDLYSMDWLWFIWVYSL